MKYSILVEQLKSVGLFVGDYGLVFDNIFDYCMVSKKAIISVDGSKYKLDNITQIGFVDADRLLTLYNKEGVEAEIHGGKFPQESKTAREMPTTTSALESEFGRLFPDFEDQLFYDELLEREMIDMAMLGESESGIVPITDAIIALYHLFLERRVQELGYLGKRFPSRPVMDEVLTIEVHKHRRNLFREWMESHEWDGVPRLRTCFIDYMGVTAPALRTSDDKSTEEEMKYIGDVTEAWFLGAVRRSFAETQHDIVPVFIGGQGAGKTRFLRFIAGDNAWFKSTVADVSKPKDFLETVRGAVVVEMAESKQIRTQDNETLKAFISQSSDQLRKAYARYEECYPRRFIFAATSNFDNVFTDLTGARRFFPMYCDENRATKPIATEFRGHKYQHEIEQIWAEALYLYNQGHRWHVSRETVELAKRMQDHCSVDNPGYIAIEEWLDDPVNGLTERGARVTREAILTGVFQADPKVPSKEFEKMYRAWRNGTRRWKSVPKPFLYNGKTCRGFERVLIPGENVVTKTFVLVDGYDDDEAPVEETAEVKLRKIVKEFDLQEFDDIPIDQVDLTREDYSHLMDEGYIYNLGTTANPTYRIGTLP